MPMFTCRRTISATVAPTVALKAAASTSSPFSRFSSSATTASLRGRLPTWLVRIRFSLVRNTSSLLVFGFHRNAGCVERADRLFAQFLPQPRGNGTEFRIGDDTAVTRARPAGLDDVD